MSRYLLYARKSTESEDRQVLSIDSQIQELREFASRQQLQVVSVLSESRSAKAPGRPVFGQVMKLLGARKADGLLCWKLDRLARNPIDGGALIWALDCGKLREIATPTNRFVNTGNDKFMMQIEFGTAKKYVDDLSDNVRRGNRAKLARGWLPGAPPLGYLNEPVERTIVPDPDRFALVRKLWDLVLAGQSPIAVLRIANEEWGLRTRRGRRRGDRPLSRSLVYSLLGNPFYYGLIPYAGDTYPGAHQPMVSKDEFDRVQELLGRPNRAPQQKHRFAFTGLIRCGECDAMVTASHHVNRFGSHYTHYHCTKRRPEPRCTQRALRVEALEEQIRALLGRIRISDRYRDWAMKHLRRMHGDEIGGREAAEKSLATASREIQRQIDALLQLRLRGLVTDGEYQGKKAELVAEQVRIRERLTDGRGRTKGWFELCEKAICFSNEAPKRFAEGSLDEQREILVALGSNPQLRDRILRMELKKPFLWMEERPRSMKPWALLDGIRTFFQEHPDSIAWPSFCRTAPEPDVTATKSQ